MHLPQEEPNLKCYEHIAEYVDDLCIAAESPSAIIDIFKTKYHLKVRGDGKLSYHLGTDYIEDLDGTYVSQLKKQIDKLVETSKRLFNEEPPNRHKTSFEKITIQNWIHQKILEGQMAAKYLTMVANFNG